MKMTTGKKPSLTSAYQLILDMKTGRRELDDYDIDALLRFFAPALPKRAKTPEQWVAKAAAGPKEQREALQYARVEDGVMYASNGHRAHRCKTAKADGFYCPKTLLPVDFHGRAIDISRVFPSRTGLIPVPSETLESGAIPDKGRLTEYLRVPGGVAVNRVYFEDATNGAPPEEIFYSYATMMFGDSEFGDWVIQGLRL